MANFGMEGGALDYLSKVWRGVQVPSQGTASVSTTSTFQYNPKLHGQCCTITLTGAITVTLDIAPNSLIAGGNYEIRFVAGDTSARTFAYNTNTIRFRGASISIGSGTTTLNSVDKFYFRAVTPSIAEDSGSVADVR